MAILYTMLKKILPFFWSITYFANAQNLIPKQLNISTESGYLIPHNQPNIKTLIEKQGYNYQAFLTQVHWHLDNKNIYNQLYPERTFGLGYYLGSFQNSSIGQPHTIFTFLNSKVLKNSRHNLMYHIALGLTYNFNPYNPNSNPDNYFIGSKTNAYIGIGLEYQYHISKKWGLGMATYLRHFSNGGYTVPNYGINLIPINLNLVYVLDKKTVEIPKIELNPFLPFNHLSILIAPSIFAKDKSDKKYMATSFSMQYMRQIGYKTRLGGGIDMAYKFKYPIQNSPLKTFEGTTLYGLFIAYDWILSKKLYATFALANYLNTNSQSSKIYERLCLKYQFDNHLICGIGVKAHQYISDYVEWTLGYAIYSDANKYR